jgi:hypothetical protein
VFAVRSVPYCISLLDVIATGNAYGYDAAARITGMEALNAFSMRCMSCGALLPGSIVMGSTYGILTDFYTHAYRVLNTNFRFSIGYQSRDCCRAEKITVRVFSLNGATLKDRGSFPRPAEAFSPVNPDCKSYQSRGQCHNAHSLRIGSYAFLLTRACPGAHRPCYCSMLRGSLHRYPGLTVPEVLQPVKERA